MKILIILFFSLLIGFSCQTTGGKEETEKKKEFLVKSAVAPELEIKEKILFCYRKLSSSGELSGMEGFLCPDYLLTDPAPFPGGGLSGRTIFSLALKILGKEKHSAIEIRSYSKGDNAYEPKLPVSKLSVDNSDSEFYNEYIVESEEAIKAVFVDIRLK
ncbi:MAG: hypothetical protein H7A25_02005 [Leptospiraceae bacterium]|nr:hypothetical protein [Leptospiraceae bacterium]MCP5498650.1 hypothetical protein [Leptospiraceae bacterium]